MLHTGSIIQQYAPVCYGNNYMHILFIVIENFIDGEALTEDEISEMLPPVGVTKKIMYLIRCVSVY